jgi:hypothetical protein
MAKTLRTPEWRALAAIWFRKIRKKLRKLSSTCDADEWRVLQAAEA